MKVIFKIFILCINLYSCRSSLNKDYNIITDVNKNYQVAFDFNDYPQEQKAIYSYLNKNKEINVIDESLKLNKIGIALNNLRDTSKEHFLIYIIQDNNYCGSIGCPFGILSKNDITGEYESLLPKREEGDAGLVRAIKILTTKTNGYYDIELFYKINKSLSSSILKMHAKYYQ